MDEESRVEEKPVLAERGNGQTGGGYTPVRDRRGTHDGMTKLGDESLKKLGSAFEEWVLSFSRQT